MKDLDNGRSDDPEQWAARSGSKDYQNTPEYGDWLYHAQEDKRYEKNLDAEGRHWAGVGKRGIKKVEVEK